MNKDEKYDMEGVELQNRHRLIIINPFYVTFCQLNHERIKKLIKPDLQT
jgi:hypothetical protein